MTTDRSAGCSEWMEAHLRIFPSVLVVCGRDGGEAGTVERFRKTKPPNSTVDTPSSLLSKLASAARIAISINCMHLQILLAQEGPGDVCAYSSTMPSVW